MKDKRSPTWPKKNKLPEYVKQICGLTFHSSSGGHVCMPESDKRLCTPTPLVSLCPHVKLKIAQNNLTLSQKLT